MCFLFRLDLSLGDGKKIGILIYETKLGAVKLWNREWAAALGCDYEREREPYVSCACASISCCRPTRAWHQQITSNCLPARPDWTFGPQGHRPPPSSAPTPDGSMHRIGGFGFGSCLWVARPLGCDFYAWLWNANRSQFVCFWFVSSVAEIRGGSLS